MPRDDGFDRCRLCGCSEMDACWDEAGPCGWAAPGLCSVCVADPVRFVRECAELAAWLEQQLPEARTICDRLTLKSTAKELAKLTGFPSRTARRQIGWSSDWSLLANVAAAFETTNEE